MSEDSVNDNGSSSSGSPASWFTLPRFALWLGVFILVSFFPVITGRQSFYFFDYGVLGYPFAFCHHEAFWRGEFFPLWNPLSNCGTPFLAQWGTLALYPGSLFYLLLPLPWSLGVFCLLHLFLGGLGMYRLARSWCGDGFGAGVAGMAFAFSGAVLASLVWPNWLVALGWMPWVVWLVERAWREGGRRVVAAALAAAMQMMSGVPELILFTWLILLVLWLAGLVKGATPRKAWVMRLLALVLLVSALSAAQLLPFLDLLANSHRHAGYATDKWSMPLWGWANLLVPLYRNARSFQGSFFQVEQQFLYSYYLGVGVLLLALAALVWQRHGRVWWLAGLALFGLVMAWGEQGLLYPWLRRAVPVLGVGRYAVKFVFLAVFAVPLLAAFAVAKLSVAPRDTRRMKDLTLLGIAAALLLTMVALLWNAGQGTLVHANATGRAVVLVLTAGGAVWLGRIANITLSRLVQLGFLALLCVDGMTHKPSLNPTIPAGRFQPGLVSFEPPVRPGEARVMISPAAEEALLQSRVPDPQNDFIGKRLALWSNLNLLEGAPKVNGSSTLQLRWQRELQDLQYATPETDLPRLADFLGVAQATAPGKVVEWSPRASFLPLFTAGQKPVFAAAAETLRALQQPDFDARQVVYLPPAAKASVTVAGAAAVKITAQKFSAHRVECEVEAAQPALLVVAQTYYHPWTAYVDGQRTALWRANHAFQALEVPAGRRQVRLVYEDWNFRAGAALSLAALIGCVAAWLFLGRKEKA